MARKNVLLARRAAVAALLKAGLSVREIQDALAQNSPPYRVSIGTVQNDIDTVRREWRTSIVTDTDEAMRLDLARLDDALRAITPSYRRGQLQAVDRLVSITYLREKILGYGAAERIKLEGKLEVEHDDPRDELIRKLNNLVEAAEEEAAQEQEAIPA